MKVTPTKKKFGKHAVGDVFDLPDGAARLFIKVGKLREVVETAAPTYQTRMMQAEPMTMTARDAATIETNTIDAAAPYGYKADGTPRKRPGRAPAAQ